MNRKEERRERTFGSRFFTSLSPLPVDSCGNNLIPPDNKTVTNGEREDGMNELIAETFSHFFAGKGKEWIKWRERDD